MRRYRRALCAALVLSLGLGLPLAMAQDHGHEQGKDHGHRSPHGGEVVSIGDYHVELLFSAEKGEVTLYVLGGDESSPLPIEAKALTAQCKPAGGTEFVALSLDPLPQPADGKGTASRFAGKAERLKGAASVELVVHVPVEGKRYRASASLAGAAKSAYVCPMGCEKEKSYPAPGRCPVCGMNLKKMDPGHGHGEGQLHSEAYRMDLVTEPKAPAAGKPMTLVFTPRRTSDGSVVAKLEIVHEQPLHLIMVSRDLGWYAHEHPVPREDGSLALTFTFPAGGEFILFADITVENDGNQVFALPLHVEGKAVAGPSLRANVGDTRRIGEYEITLKPSALVVGEHVTLAYTVRKGGKEVTDLQPYLGALGHCVFISQDGTRYLHSHPAGEHRGGEEHGEGGGETRGGPVVEFATAFPAAGIYKGWAQFQHEGRILTADFVVQVPAAGHDAGKHHGH